VGRRSTGTVEARASSIRLKFTHLGERQLETLDLKPTPANIKAAERTLAKIVASIDAGVYRRSSFFQTTKEQPIENTTFGEFAKLWIATSIAEHGTRKHYQAAIDKVWGPSLGSTKLDALRASQIRKIVAKRAETVTGKTINNDLIPLRAILEAAVEDRLIQVSPAAQIKNLKFQKPVPDPFTLDEVERILADMRDKAPIQVWAYYEFAFCTGLRPSEQIIARWGKIDWTNLQIRIDAAKTYGREKGTKTGTIRDVDLTPRSVAALVAMKPFTFMKGLDHPIFANPATGQPWATDEYQRTTYFVPTLKRLGIRHRPAYQTRHTYATTALMNGISPPYISRQMGHKNTAMLFQTYSKWIDGGDKGREAAKMAALYQDPNCPRIVPGEPKTPANAG